MMNNMNILYACDYYKVAHKGMLPQGITKQYNNFVARANKYLPQYDKLVVFGVERAWDKIVKKFDEDFFNLSELEVGVLLLDYKHFIETTLGIEYDVKHWKSLYELGHLPVKCRAIPEGTEIPMGTPFFTIENTNDRFAWLVGWLETVISAEMWKPTTVATVVKKGYYDVCMDYAEKTCDNNLHVPFQCHDFSARGQANMEDAINNGLAHLQYFDGTDNVPAMKASGKTGICSISATEHSVMCAYGEKNELDLYKKLITETVPSGLVSIVSDTWDYFNVIDNYLPALKDQIMARDGKVVIRGDSGNPADIACGSAKVIDLQEYDFIEEALDILEERVIEEERESAGFGCIGNFDTVRYMKHEGKIYKVSYDLEWNRWDKTYYFLETVDRAKIEEVELTSEQKGSIEVLWETFGGTINSKGYKVLDPHIGFIYGDGITPELLKEILHRLEEKGFASENMVFGVGSYSLSAQYSRDSFGMAIKSTHIVVDGEERLIYKNPKTASSAKKSLKGRAVVLPTEDSYKTVDNLNIEEEKSYENDNVLKVFFNK